MVLLETLQRYLTDGWVEIPYTLVYVDATHFKIEGVDVTAYFKTGTPIKLTQTTDKYFYIASTPVFSTDTTVQITGGSDYTLANAAITAPYFGINKIPTGFPFWFNYAPNQFGFSSLPTNGICRFSINGKTVSVVYREGGNGTSNNTGYTIDLPITAKTVTNIVWQAQTAFTDNSANSATPGVAVVQSAGTVATFYKDANLATWTASGGKRIRQMTNLEYEI